MKKKGKKRKTVKRMKRSEDGMEARSRWMAGEGVSRGGERNEPSGRQRADALRLLGLAPRLESNTGYLKASQRITVIVFTIFGCHGAHLTPG